MHRFHSKIEKQMFIKQSNQSFSQSVSVALSLRLSCCLTTAEITEITQNKTLANMIWIKEHAISKILVLCE